MMGRMSLAMLAGLLADPSRAAFCMALLDGRAWTAGELARHAGIAPSTASAHVTLLVDGGVLADERQGRHRYVRLADPAMASLIEELAAHAARLSTPARPSGLREATQAKAIARARTCYDHLAGRLGVAITDALLERRLVTDKGFGFTDAGLDWLSTLDMDVEELAKAKRPFAKQCLDWTERRPHLAGGAGAALCAQAFSRGWVERIGTGRALRVTPAGRTALAERLGLNENRWS
jgi:DNA-binding transcriptional ArsR family regulator